MLDPSTITLLARAVPVVGLVALLAIRAPHQYRSYVTGTARKLMGALEVLVLLLGLVGILLPVAWALTPVLSFADYAVRIPLFLAGLPCIVLGLWLFYRSHADLGTNWSVTLEIRQTHRLVTAGVYRWVRHPMYSAMLAYSLGLALVVPNWVGGPACLVAIGVLLALRIGPEERMLIEQFGRDYEEYMDTTKRLIPGVW